MKAPQEQAMTGHPDSGLAAISSRHPTVGLAAGMIRDGRLSSFYGHGLADIASDTPVTEDTVFRVGSLTKTFTAIAILQLCEQRLVDLDAPAGEYLRAYRLIPAKPGHRPRPSGSCSPIQLAFPSSSTLHVLSSLPWARPWPTGSQCRHLPSSTGAGFT